MWKILTPEAYLDPLMIYLDLKSKVEHFFKIRKISKFGLQEKYSPTPLSRLFGTLDDQFQ